jgi:hypothetical protein
LRRKKLNKCSLTDLHVDKKKLSPILITNSIDRFLITSISYFGSWNRVIETQMEVEAHTYYPSYLGGGDPKDQSSGLVQTKSDQDATSTNQLGVVACLPTTWEAEIGGSSYETLLKK